MAKSVGPIELDVNEQMLNVQALSFSQNGNDMYLTIMTARDLIAYSKVDYWNSKTNSGYQRPLSEGRLKEIADYLLIDKGTFPTSFLVNIRGKISIDDLKEISNEIHMCKVTVGDDALPLWIIDGQHRLYGLQRAIEKNEKINDFPVVVCIFNSQDPYNEMRQFHIVNSRAKGVPTDLAQRHLYEMSQKVDLGKIIQTEGSRNALAAVALQVVDSLIKNPESPWYQKVRLPDQTRKTKEQIIRQRPLAESIAIILENRRRYQRNLSQLTELLIDYWIALSEIFPAAFDDPTNYMIQKTPGIYSLHTVLPEILDYLGKDEPSKEELKGTLSKMFETAGRRLNATINDDFWSRKLGTGHLLAQSTSQKMIRALTTYFSEALWQKDITSATL